jgi:hypothetical protein
MFGAVTESGSGTVRAQGADRRNEEVPMARTALDDARLRNLRKELPAIEAELRGLAKHCGMLSDSAASWQQVPRTLLDVQIQVVTQATRLLKRLGELEAEARAIQAKGKGPPPQQRSPRQPMRFQTSADVPPAVRRAKQAATEFDRSFGRFRKTVDEMMNDPLRAADLLEPTGLAKVISDVGTVAELALSLVEWLKRKR